MPVVLSTSRRSFEMSALTPPLPEADIVSAAIVAAVSTSKMRQLIVEETVIS